MRVEVGGKNHIESSHLLKELVISTNWLSIRILHVENSSPDVDLLNRFAIPTQGSGLGCRATTCNPSASRLSNSSPSRTHIIPSLLIT